jgi:hypothetical protein
MKSLLKARSLRSLFLMFFLGAFSTANSQNGVVIGGTTPNPSAILTLIGNGNQAVIIPATADHNNITKSAGMLVYNTTDKTLYYCDGTSWKNISSGTLTLTPGPGINIAGTTISNSGDTNATDDITTATTAAGDLVGNYPDPTVAKIRGVNVTGTAPTNNQVLQYNGTNWAPATLPVVALPTLTSGQLMTNNGTSNVGVNVSGDATFNQSGALTISTGAINSTKIADGSIATGDIAAGAITGGAAGVIADGSIVNADVSSTAAIAVTKLAPGTNGQVLTVNAGAASWQTPTTAVTKLDDLSDVTVGTATSGQVLVNNGSGQFQNVSMSGDISISNTGATTIQAGAISGGAAGDITDGTVTNADISATAAIAGTKITPDFGSQNIVTTGNTVFNSVTNVWPTSQGASNTFLKNDGAGNLTWSTTPSPFSTVNVVPKGDGVGMMDSQIANNGLDVGIGTTTPSHRLSLYNPTSYSLINFLTGTTGPTSSDGFMIGLDNEFGDADIWNWEPGKYIQFGTSGTQRMVIDGTGNVGVGAPSPTTKLEVNGYTKLGSDFISSADYIPAIKVKKITMTSAGSQGGCASVAHNITPGKILSVQVMIEYSTNNFIQPAYTFNAGYEYNWVINPAGNLQVCNVGANSINVLSKPVIILITYEE